MMELLASLYYDAGKDREAASGLQLPDQGEAAGRQDPGLAEPDRRLRAAGRRQEADRGPGPAAGEDPRRRREALGQRQDRRRQEGGGRRPRPVGAHPLQHRGQLAHRGPEDPRRRHLRVRPRGLRRLPDPLPPEPSRPTTCASTGRSSSTDYLRKYPEASEQYTQVVQQDGAKIDAKPPAKPGKWLPNAAFNAVYAADEVVRRAEQKGEIKPPAAADLKTVVPLAPQRKRAARRLRAVPQVPAQGREAGGDRLQGGQALLRPPPLRRGGVPLQRDRPHRSGPQVRQRRSRRQRSPPTWSSTPTTPRATTRRSTSGPGASTPTTSLATGKFKGGALQGHRAVQLQAGQRPGGEARVRRGGAGISRLREGLPQDPDRRQGALQRLHRLLQSAHAGEGAGHPRAPLPQLPEEHPGPALPVGQRRGVRGDRATSSTPPRPTSSTSPGTRGSSVRPKKSAKKSSSKKRPRRANQRPPRNRRRKARCGREAKAQIALFNARGLPRGSGTAPPGAEEPRALPGHLAQRQDSETVALSIAALHERMGNNSKAVAFLEERSASRSVTRTSTSPPRPVSWSSRSRS